MSNIKINNNYNVYFNNDNIQAPYVEAPNGSFYKVCYNTNCVELFNRRSSMVHNLQEGLKHDFIINMYNMYTSCSNLIGAPICGNNVINMAGAYAYCSNLTGSPVCGNNVIYAQSAYVYCNNLTGSPVCGDNVTNMYNMYHGCTGLNGSPVCGNNVIDMSNTYQHCYNLTGTPVVGDKVTRADYTYYNCGSISGSFNLGDNLVNTAFMFANSANDLYGDCYWRNYGQYTSWGSTYNAECYGLFNKRGTSVNRLNLHILRDSVLNNIIYNANIENTAGWQYQPSLIGGNFTWEFGTDCYYNSLYNLYIYYDLT